MLVLLAQSYFMSPEHRTALEFVRSSHHVLWGEVERPVRYLLCDLLLDRLLDLGYHDGKPYVFTVSIDGQRALQAMGMGDV